MAYWMALCALILVDVCAIVFGWLDAAQVRDLKFTLVELTIYITVFGIAGGLIKRAVDEHEALASFRHEVTSALSEIYAKIHVLRRALAMWPNDPQMVRERVFELMDVQHALGRIGRQVRTKRDVGQRQVLAELATIRIYVEELIDETVRSSKDGQLEMGPKLEQFIAGCHGEDRAASESYQRRFDAPYLRAMCAADPAWALTEEQCRIRELRHSQAK